MQHELAKFAGTSSVRIVKTVNKLNKLPRSVASIEEPKSPKATVQEILCNIGNYVQGKSVNMEQMSTTRQLPNQR